MAPVQRVALHLLSAVPLAVPAANAPPPPTIFLDPRHSPPEMFHPPLSNARLSHNDHTIPVSAVDMKTTHLDAKNGTSGSPWTQCLDEILEMDPDGIETGLSEVLRRLLASQSDAAPAEAAQQIDDLYSNDYLPSDPLMRFQDDKGMGGFLSCLYEMVFDLARAIPYENDLQGRLVQFLVELAKLPTKEVKIWGEDCLAYARALVYSVIQDDNWNGSYQHTASAASDPETPATLQRYSEWVNFSTFVARVIRAGHDDRYTNWDKYPSFDIAKGLESDSDQGPRRDCLILVATQYLQIVGEKLHRKYVEECAVDSERGQKALGLWRLWSDRLQEIANGQTSSNPEVAKAAREAWQFMMSLEPSTQAESQEVNASISAAPVEF
ncbi:hypothetical protein PG993_013361 [Apiospora rasikravindrae]|uniref:Uncharacterized protein n=1 Tax=Apiospora rasikravindrae TaxID=990691 RepID=A0ABR1RZJ7_9PEZI